MRGGIWVLPKHCCCWINLSKNITPIIFLILLKTICRFILFFLFWLTIQRPNFLQIQPFSSLFIFLHQTRHTCIHMQFHLHIWTFGYLAPSALLPPSQPPYLTCPSNLTTCHILMNSFLITSTELIFSLLWMPEVFYDSSLLFPYYTQLFLRFVGHSS